MAFDHPYLSFNDHCDQKLSKKSFFYWYYFHFLERFLNDFELVFLEFKHIYKTQRTGLFSFYLFICYLLFHKNSMHKRSPTFRTFPMHLNTQDESALFLFVISQSLFAIMLSTFCSLKRSPNCFFFCYLSSMSISWWSLNFLKIILTSAEIRMSKLLKVWYQNI